MKKYIYVGVVVILVVGLFIGALWAHEDQTKKAEKLAANVQTNLNIVKAVDAQNLKVSELQTQQAQDNLTTVCAFIKANLTKTETLPTECP